MKKLLSVLICTLLLAVSGCNLSEEPAQIAATTLPVYDFTVAICENTPITVTRLVTEEVSCLHDYSLNVRQVKAAEAAEVIVMSGAGLEEFLDDMLIGTITIDASHGIELICPEEDHGHEHEEEEEHGHEGHSHDQDPHIWLSPVNAIIMAENICDGLTDRYPEYEAVFADNLKLLLDKLESLQQYGENALREINSREIITFHDGFAYFADSFGLTILEAVEEESGSEASAKELIHLIEIINAHDVKAIFTEANGSTSAASIISRETGTACASLDMAMAGDSYFDAIYHNIDTLKEALQ